MNSGGMTHSEQEQLVDVVLKHKPYIIVETGIFAGASSLLLLKCLKQLNQGILFSFDDNKTLGEKTGHLVSDDLKQRWRPLFNTTSPACLNNFPKAKIDMFLHDSEHTDEVMGAELQWALAHINPGGWIIAHDVNLCNVWTEFIKEIQISDKFEVRTIGNMITLAGVQIK